jgi:predicted nucleic acid-binding Zn ribbon protein
MERIGDLLPETARRLGLEDELRLVRAAGTWATIVAERVPAATGATRLQRLERGVLLVDADSPIVAQELRLRTTELLAAFRAAPGGLPASELAVRVRAP